jgi:hypothetical protein
MSHFEDYEGMINEAEAHHDDTHDKKHLRISSWNDVCATNVLDKIVWNSPHKFAVYKVKIFEIGKPGKTIRMIGDLGCPASLQGFRITNATKTAMFEEPLNIGNGLIEFCKVPKPSSLVSVFEKLINPPGKFYFAYFSDDSCLSYRTKSGEILRFNVDISSCDASHTSSLFDAYVNIHPPQYQVDARKLVRQCEQAVTITNLFNKKEKVTLQPDSARLYSGSTITTSLNNLACQTIALAISQTDITCKQDVVNAARDAGYVVTCDECTNWHHLQFLKHSPVIDTGGDLRALLNLGVLLRLSGSIKGDVPGSRNASMKSRCDRQQASLLQGAYPRASFKLLFRMKRVAGGQFDEKNDVLTRKALEYKVVMDDSDCFMVDDEEVYARYGLTELEILQMNDDFGECGYGQFYASEATNKIYQADYGLSSQYLSVAPPEGVKPHFIGTSFVPTPSI